jgi:hypothetical protein
LWSYLTSVVDGQTLELYGDLTGEEGMFFDPNVVDGVKRLFFNKKTGEALKVFLVIQGTSVVIQGTVVVIQRTFVVI